MNFLNAASALNSQFNSSSSSNSGNAGSGNQSNNGGAGIPDLSSLTNLLGGGDTGSGNDNKSSGGGFDLSSLGSLLGVIPQAEEKKSKLMEYIAPIVKVMSPKWGDVIVGVLKNLDLEKLLSITQNETELEKKVRSEEERLEKQRS